jgi:cyclase
MRRISKNTYADPFRWGCVPGFIVTSDGVLLVDTPQQPIDAVRWRDAIRDQFGPIRHLVNTEPHGDHIRGNAYFPGVEVIGQAGMVERYQQWIPRITSEELHESLKTTDPDSYWLFNHPKYPPNPPTRTFESELTLHLGDTEIRILHHPGHTAVQTSVWLPAEGVVFTGDNIFHQCKSFIQEADPWQWLEALERIRQLKVETIVPGHGEPCDPSYLNVQAEVIRNWIGQVEDFIARGLNEDEALRALDVKKLDPFPLDQRIWDWSERVDTMNIRNIYNHILARQAQPA